ncbi:MAG: cyclic nucleotide-binding domain-containing protein [Magnetococcales bacterium]|nr:cyclic nucleotide-binding domain-containing protein [Magnetococcales bacterium]
MLMMHLMDRIPFFSAFTEEEKRSLVEEQVSCFANYDKGGYLTREGEQDRALFILIKGRARVFKRADPDHPITTLEPGSVFGEISFLTGQSRTTDIVAIEDLLVFKVDDPSILARMDLSLQLKIKDKMIEVLVSRLEHANRTVIACRQ